MAMCVLPGKPPASPSVLSKAEFMYSVIQATRRMNSGDGHCGHFLDEEGTQLGGDMAG